MFVNHFFTSLDFFHLVNSFYHSLFPSYGHLFRSHMLNRINIILTFEQSSCCLSSCGLSSIAVEEFIKTF